MPPLIRKAQKKRTRKRRQERHAPSLMSDDEAFKFVLGAIARGLRPPPDDVERLANELGSIDAQQLWDGIGSARDAAAREWHLRQQEPDPRRAPALKRWTAALKRVRSAIADIRTLEEDHENSLAYWLAYDPTDEFNGLGNPNSPDSQKILDRSVQRATRFSLRLDQVDRHAARIEAEIEQCKERRHRGRARSLDSFFALHLGFLWVDLTGRLPKTTTDVKTGETSSDFADFVVRAFAAEQLPFDEHKVAALAVQVAKADKRKLRAFRDQSIRGSGDFESPRNEPNRSQTRAAEA